MSCEFSSSVIFLSAEYTFLSSINEIKELFPLNKYHQSFLELLKHMFWQGHNLPGWSIFFPVYKDVELVKMYFISRFTYHAKLISRVSNK